MAGTGLEEHHSPRAVVARAQIVKALDDGELVLHYQPIFSLSTGKLSGVEALLRWQHPQGGLLAPDDFVPAIADTPVITQVTSWVVTTALTQVQAWPGLRVSVNVTGRDVSRSDFADHVLGALETTGIAPERLVLELTEQAMVQNLDTAGRGLQQLRHHGVGLSLDDFGTGYSSLLYLRELPITELKIDRLFVSQLPGSDEDLAIVRSVAQLGRAVGIQVVAEGVETWAQAQAVRSARCSSAQGFLWGQPGPAETVDPGQRIELPRRSAEPASRSVSARTKLAQQVRVLLRDGASLHTIAAALNSDGLRTEKGTRWSAAAVAQLISRNFT